MNKARTGPRSEAELLKVPKLNLSYNFPIKTVTQVVAHLAVMQEDPGLNLAHDEMFSLHNLFFVGAQNKSGRTAV